MEFRNLKKQYELNKADFDTAIEDVLKSSRFISGPVVSELESELCDYVGVKHCITCANGTDALEMALRAWNIGEGDAVFVPDFTFFSSGEVVSLVGASPVFVDVYEDTFNINCEKLELMIEKILAESALKPKVIVAVDLFGLPANYPRLREIADKYDMKILEDGAQGFGGSIDGKKVCSFGDISTTSFFPAKPLGCYGDGGAIFTDCDETAALIKSLCVHGKGINKYDNIRIGRNSRLDSLQAAILRVKLKLFIEHELEDVNTCARIYDEMLAASFPEIPLPLRPEGYVSSFAQYTIKLTSKEKRDALQKHLKEKNIPSMIYYVKPMHKQEAFDTSMYDDANYEVTNKLVDTVLSLPMGPYLTREEIDEVVGGMASI